MGRRLERRIKKGGKGGRGGEEEEKRRGEWKGVEAPEWQILSAAQRFRLSRLTQSGPPGTRILV